MKAVLHTELSQDREKAEAKLQAKKGQGRRETVTQEKVDAAWSKFRTSFDLDSPILEKAIHNSRLSLQNAGLLQLEIPNAVVGNRFTAIKPKVLATLKELLQNDAIDLEITEAVNTNGSSAKKLYTESDKFKHLLENYPLLGIMKDRLGLDLKG